MQIVDVNRVFDRLKTKLIGLAVHRSLLPVRTARVGNQPDSRGHDARENLNIRLWPRVIEKPSILANQFSVNEDLPTLPQIANHIPVQS